MRIDLDDGVKCETETKFTILSNNALRDDNITKNISSFIASRIESAVFINENIVPKQSDETDSTYGQTIEKILLNIMGLDSIRNDDLGEKLNKLQMLLRKNNVLQDEKFQTLLNEVTESLLTLL